MPAIVTKDVQYGRQRTKNKRNRGAADCKQAAHRRHRAHQREEIRQIKAGQKDADEGDFVSRPGTGWDVW